MPNHILNNNQEQEGGQEAEPDVNEAENQESNEVGEQQTKEEQEYQENIAKLTERAENVLLEAKQKKIKKELSDKELELKQLEPVLTIEKQKEIDKKRGFSLKDKMRRASFGLRLKENADDMIAFVNYLEENIAVTKRESPYVKRTDMEKEKAKYEKDGYSVEIDNICPEDEKEESVRLDITKKIPYKFDSAHTKELATLLVQKNDPIEVLERLQRIGFNISGFTLNPKYDRFKGVSSFVSSKDAISLLKKLEEINIKGYYQFGVEYRGSKFEGKKIENAFLDFAERDAKENILTPEVQSKFVLLAQDDKTNFSLEKIETYLEFAQDEKMSNLLVSLTRVLNNLDFTDNQTIRNLKLLEEAGLEEPILDSLQKNIRLSYLSELFSYNGRELEHAQGIVNDLKNQVESSEFNVLSQDKELLDFADKVSLFTGQNISVDYLDKYRELQTYPETIAVLGLFSEWKMKDMNYFLGHNYDNLSNILKNKELLGTIAKLEFQEFMNDMQEKLGYKIEIGNLVYFSGNIVDLFNNAEAKQKILSENGVELINYLGKFDSEKRTYYEKLIDCPNILPILKRLEENFGLHYGNTQGVGYGADDLIKLAQDEEQQTHLFSEKAIGFVNNLQEAIDYKLKTGDILHLSHGARFDSLPLVILEKENVKLINKTVDYCDLRGLGEFAGLGDEQKDVISRLVDSFDHKLNLNSINASYSLNTKNRAVLRTLTDNKELQDKLFNEDRVAMINKISEGLGGYRFKLQDIEALVGMPEDIAEFSEELKEHNIHYVFNVKDLGNLAKFNENKEKLFILFDNLNKAGVNYIPAIGNVSDWIDVASSDTAKLAEKISFFAQASSGYSFEPGHVDCFTSAIELDYQLKDIRDLKKIYDEHKAEYDKDFHVFLISTLIDFRENKEIIINTNKELENMGILHLDVMKDASLIKNIADNSLLPTIKFLLEYGNIQSKYGSIDNVLRDFQHLNEFAKDDNYEDIIKSFKIIHGFNENFSFNLDDLAWYKDMAEISDIEQKVEYLDKNTPRLHVGVIKTLIACKGDTKKTMQIQSMINDEYFEKNKDAQKNLDNFVMSFRDGECPMDMFVNIMTLSKDARKTKQLFMRTMALDQLQYVIDPKQNVDYTFLEQSKNISEVLETTNKHFVEKAVTVLFNGENSDEARLLKEKIEKLLPKDENFEHDFETIATSIAIYAKKYPPLEGYRDEFNNLMSALRKTTELICIRDTEEFKQERFNYSKEQFDRIFEQVPEADRASIEEMWLDTSQVVKGSLDETSVTKGQVLKNKLNEIRRIFEIEVLPDLKVLFKDKVDILKELSESDNKNVDLFKTRLAVFQEYIINTDGDIQPDFIKVYRTLSKDIKGYEKSLKSKETAKDEKKKISKKLGVMKYTKDVLKGIYKLSNINPDKMETRKDYIREIDDIVELISSNLHKLALVDKEKEVVDNEDVDLEIDIRDHLEYLGQVVQEEDHQKKVKIQTQFVVDFDDLAHCPELTNSCQRLTEVTGYNEAAYSRILDGVNELIDLWEIKNKKGKNNKLSSEKQQRLARCFTELTTIKVPNEENPRLAVLLDRIYISPNHTTFYTQCLENIFKTALGRFASRPEVSILASSTQFRGYKDLIQEIASEYGYSFKELDSIEYFVNESNLKLYKGKYYDSHGGAHDTSKSYYDNTETMYVLEKIA